METTHYLYGKMNIEKWNNFVRANTNKIKIEFTEDDLQKLEHISSEDLKGLNMENIDNERCQLCLLNRRSKRFFAQFFNTTTEERTGNYIMPNKFVVSIAKGLMAADLQPGKDFKFIPIVKDKGQFPMVKLIREVIKQLEAEGLRKITLATDYRKGEGKTLLEAARSFKEDCGKNSEDMYTLINKENLIVHVDTVDPKKGLLSLLTKGTGYQLIEDVIKKE